MLMKDVKVIVTEAFAAQAAAASKKSKKAPTSIFRLTEGAEPKLLAVREMLTVYRDVYLKNKGLRGADLLDKIHSFIGAEGTSSGRRYQRHYFTMKNTEIIPRRYEICGDTSRRQRK